MSSIKQILRTAVQLDKVEIVNAVESYPNDQDLGRWLRRYVEERANTIEEGTFVSSAPKARFGRQTIKKD